MKDDINPYKVAEDLLGPPGRILHGGKVAPPEKRAVWNSNVFAGTTKVWCGDIFIADSEKKLQTLADQTDATVRVLRESNGRFNEPDFNEAVAAFEPSG